MVHSRRQRRTHRSSLHFHYSKPFVILAIGIFSIAVFVSITPSTHSPASLTGMQVRLGQRVSASTGESFQGTNIYQKNTAFYLCNVNRAGGDFRGTIQQGDVVDKVLFFRPVATLDDLCFTKKVFPYITCQKHAPDNDLIRWSITAHTYCGDEAIDCAVALIEDKQPICAVIIPETQETPSQP